MNVEISEFQIFTNTPHTHKYDCIAEKKSACNSRITTHLVLINIMKDGDHGFFPTFCYFLLPFYCTVISGQMCLLFCYPKCKSVSVFITFDSSCQQNKDSGWTKYCFPLWMAWLFLNEENTVNLWSEQEKSRIFSKNLQNGRSLGKRLMFPACPSVDAYFPSHFNHDSGKDNFREGMFSISYNCHHSELAVYLCPDLFSITLLERATFYMVQWW